jgi:hypothetical protein
MPRKSGTSRVDESRLTKMELRKLGALRKSLGNVIADKAFAEWYRTRPAVASGMSGDRNAAKLAALIEPEVLASRVKIPRGGYLVRRGRGRVIVELAAS